MARRPIRVKEPLIIKDVEIRDLENLRENFDIDAVIENTFNGKLSKWLRERYYDEEADAVDELKKDDPELEEQLYDIFDVEPPMDEEEIAWRNERLAKLKQYTNDEEILANVDCVAFDQEDLSDCIDAEIDEIYLCDNTFTIPLKVKNKTYIGIGDAVAVIRSSKPIDFDSLNIHFQKINFDPEYEKIAPPIEEPVTPEDLYKLGLAAEGARIYDDAIDSFEKAAEMGYVEAMSKLGQMYYDGIGIGKDVSVAFGWFSKAAEKGDRNAMSQIAGMYKKGEGVKKDFDKAMYWYNEATNSGDETAKSQLENLKSKVALTEKRGAGYDEIKVDGTTARGVAVVINKTGVHSHPAYYFVQTASQFKSKIQVSAKGKKCDGKSILMIMALGLSYGTEVTIMADGPDAEEAVRTLKDIVDDGFGEA